MPASVEARRWLPEDDLEGEKRAEVKHEYVQGRVYAMDHPILVVEVLSPATEGYDRGEKFAWYRRLPSLQEYVLADPRRYAVDVFRRNERGRWELSAFAGESARVELASVDFTAPMTMLYEGVDFRLDEANDAAG